jgi:hypothetical protein
MPTKFIGAAGMVSLLVRPELGIDGRSACPNPQAGR